MFGEDDLFDDLLPMVLFGILDPRCLTVEDAREAAPETAGEQGEDRQEHPWTRKPG